MKACPKFMAITDDQVIKNKIPNEKILFIAANIGLLPLDEYKTLKSIGESKQVSELENASPDIDGDALRCILQRLLKSRLIEVS